MNNKTLLTTLILSVLTVGCGGGGGSSDTPTPPTSGGSGSVTPEVTPPVKPDGGNGNSGTTTPEVVPPVEPEPDTKPPVVVSIAEQVANMYNINIDRAELLCEEGYYTCDIGGGHLKLSRTAIGSESFVIDINNASAKYESVVTEVYGGHSSFTSDHTLSSSAKYMTGVGAEHEFVQSVKDKTTTSYDYTNDSAKISSYHLFDLEKIKAMSADSSIEFKNSTFVVANTGAKRSRSTSQTVSMKSDVSSVIFELMVNYDLQYGKSK